MIIDTVKGDILTLFKQGKGHIIHGCNCFHTMGAGVAGQLAKEFPGILTVDKSTGYGDMDKLGKFSVWINRIGMNYMMVLNLYTQYKPGPNASYDAIEEGFKRINDNFPNMQLPFMIPMIGCGIGGLTWGNVSEIINRVTPDLDLIYVEYDG